MARYFKVVYPFTGASQAQIEDFTKTLEEILPKIKRYNLSTSVDRYDKNTIFVVIHGLKSIEGARGFSELIEQDDKYKITKTDYFGITSQNYKTIQIHKNLDTYLQAQ